MNRDLVAVDLDGDDDADAQFSARINAHVTPTVDDTSDHDDSWDDEPAHPDDDCGDPRCCPPRPSGGDPVSDDSGDSGSDDPRGGYDLAGGAPLDDLRGHDGVTEAITRATPGAGPRFNRTVAWGMGALAAASAVAVLGGAVLFYSGGETRASVAPSSSLGDPQAVVVAQPTASAPPAVAAGTDRSLPYTADAVESCPAGSTAAQTMAGADPRNAFVCVRNGAEGQVIEIDLGKTYVITAISLTPGWVGLDASGVSQWGQHRVVTLVQYLFNDVDRTLITQDTHNVHGEAVQPVKRVLASKITMLIRQTSRPPAEPATTAPAAGGGGLTSVFGTDAPAPPLVAPPAADIFGPSATTNSDPVDATFAIGGFKVIGHEAI